MRHQVAGRKLGKKTAHRNAMFANMAKSLIEYGRIKTTLPKAHEFKRLADKLITLGKVGTLHARRMAFNWLRSETAVKKLFTQIAPVFKDRNGGYTRIFHLGTRPGDSAKMALVEYLSEDMGKLEPAKPKKEAKTKKEAKAKKEPKEKKVDKPAEKKKTEEKKK